MSMSLMTIPLDTITERIEARAIHQHGVAALTQKMRLLGFLPQFPILVSPLNGTGTFRLIDGAHRVEAAKHAGLTEVSALMREPCADLLEEVALARASNEASGTMVPTTLVDDAALVWRLADTGYTQIQIGEALGWSRSGVSDYIALRKIAPDVWKGIAATFELSAQETHEDGAATDAAIAASPFTEGLLRHILDLTPAQQLLLCTKLARGKNGKYTKSDFKRDAERCYARNALNTQAATDVVTIPEPDRATYLAAVHAEFEHNRAYIDEWLVKKTPGAKYAKLLQAQLDDYEKKTHVRVFCRDIRALTPEDIADNSIDAIITDPPYINEAIDLFTTLGEVASRTLKPGGSLIVLCGQAHLPEYLRGLSASLTYRWTLACHMPGGQAVQAWGAQVNAFWKPVLWFVKEPFPGQKWVSDHFSTPVNSNDKRFHHWGQSEHCMRELLERFTTPGEVIYDPFLGGGTTGVVAKMLGRKFVGSDYDETLVHQALTRIHGGA